MSSVKIHAFEGTDDGSVSCDFRGPLSIGANEGDQHRTLFEVKNVTEDEIAAVLEFGPKLNTILAKAEAPADGPIGTITGGKKVGVRIGIWDPGIEG